MTAHRRYHNRREQLRHWMGVRQWVRIVALVARRVRAEREAGR